MRKLLTSNKEADVNCEALMEDNDLRRHFTRDEFEKLIEPFIEQFRETLQTFVTNAGKFYFPFLRKKEWLPVKTSSGMGVLSYQSEGILWLGT